MCLVERPRLAMARGELADGAPELLEQRAHPPLDVVAHPPYLVELGTSRVADPPVEPPHTVRQREAPDAPPHRDDHVRGPQHLVRDRPRVALRYFDSDLLERARDLRVEAWPGVAARSVHRDRAAGERSRQPCGELATATATQAHEDDVPGACGPIGRARERHQAFARVAVREHREEVLDRSLARQAREGVVHQLVDPVGRESVAELVLQIGAELVDVVARHLGDVGRACLLVGHRLEALRNPAQGGYRTCGRRVSTW